MCRCVVFDETEQVAETQGELAEIIGRENVVILDGDAIEDIYCLCPVDLEASAKRAGYEHSDMDAGGELDGVDWHWRKVGN